MAGKGRQSGKPILADVAKIAEVSPITVSRVPRTPGAVSKPLRDRVLEAVRDIGYVPNCTAQALASPGTTVIGAVIPSMTNLVFNDVLRGIYDGI
jgi:LacI family gluconate utilization system Gnt-I transcriptional repressor